MGPTKIHHMAANILLAYIAAGKEQTGATSAGPCLPPGLSLPLGQGRVAEPRTTPTPWAQQGASVDKAFPPRFLAEGQEQQAKEGWFEISHSGMLSEQTKLPPNAPREIVVLFQGL